MNIKSLSAKELAKILKLDYAEAKFTHENNNIGICSLKETILGAVTHVELLERINNRHDH